MALKEDTTKAKVLRKTLSRKASVVAKNNDATRCTRIKIQHYSFYSKDFLYHYRHFKPPQRTPLAATISFHT